MAKILVTEIQKFVDGNIATPSYAYDDTNSAEAKYHTILAAAAISELPVHAAIMFSEEGFPLKHECYKHTVEAAPEEEPDSLFS